MPYILFMSYGIFIILDEGVYSAEDRNKTHVDKIFIEQQEKLKAAHGHHAAPAAEAHAEEAHH